ncbi:MAG: hypothetical protein AAB766_02405 [Patescibacteria group bacterium]
MLHKKQKELISHDYLLLNLDYFAPIRQCMGAAFEEYFFVYKFKLLETPALFGYFLLALNSAAKAELVQGRQKVTLRSNASNTFVDTIIEPIK